MRGTAIYKSWKFRDTVKVILKGYRIQRALASARTLCPFPEYSPIFQNATRIISEDPDGYGSISEGPDDYRMISSVETQFSTGWYWPILWLMTTGLHNTTSPSCTQDTFPHSHDAFPCLHLVCIVAHLRIPSHIFTFHHISSHSIAHHRVSHASSRSIVHLHVSPCIFVFHRASSRFTVHLRVSSRIFAFHHASSRFITHLRVSSRIFAFHHASSHFIMHLRVSSRIFAFHHASSRFIAI